MSIGNHFTGREREVWIDLFLSWNFHQICLTAACDVESVITAIGDSNIICRSGISGVAFGKVFFLTVRGKVDVCFHYHVFICSPDIVSLIKAHHLEGWTAWADRTCTGQCTLVTLQYQWNYPDSISQQRGFLCHMYGIWDENWARIGLILSPDDQANN